MKRSLFNKWIKALESGRYKQGQEKLGNPKWGFCCLGLLCHVARVEFKVKATELPGEFAARIGMHPEGKNLNDSGMWSSLVLLNDSGLSFKQIAATISKNPTQYIKSIDP